MRVLTLTTQKGGAGKTTLAASLAVAAMQDGETVLAVDVDPQGSLAAWGKRRQDEGVTVRAAEPSGLRDIVGRERKAGRTSLVVVDTPGVFGGGVTLALQDADLCLLPVKPSILDVEASRPAVEQLKVLRKPFAFVLNQCNPVTQARTLDAATALVKTGALAPSMVAARSDFLDAMIAGQGVTESAAKGKAAQEIRLLWAWIKTKMEDR